MQRYNSCSGAASVAVQSVATWLMLLAIGPIRNMPARGAEPAPSTQPAVAYLFTSFRGNGEDGLHLAYSYDGYRWTDLDRSFLAPKVGVSKLMRDPFICRGPDGTFHMVWTTGWNEKGFGYARSNDLLAWSEQKYAQVMAHEPTTMNTWAPEIVYDQPSRRFLIFWASTILGRFPGDDEPNRRNHRMYYCDTEDFSDFTKAKLLFDPGYSIIDATIITRPGNSCVIVFKDERTSVKKLRVALSPDILGPYKDISEPFTDQHTEGPSAIRIGDEWFVYFDRYQMHQYGAVKTRDFTTWTDISRELSFPKDHRHGNVLTVPRAVIDRVERESRQGQTPPIR